MELESNIDGRENAQSQDTIRRQSEDAERLNDSAAGKVTRTVHELMQQKVMPHIEETEESRVDATTLVLIDILENPKISLKAFMQVKESLKKFGPYDSLKVLKMDRCAVEVADRRRHAIRAITVDLFYEACVLHGHNQQEMIAFLVGREEIGDHTLRAIVGELKKEFGDRDIVKFCAENGYLLTSIELAVRFPQHREKCFMDILSSLQPISYYTHCRVRNDEIAVEAFNRLTPNLHSLDCIDDNSNNVLHLAGDKGLTALTKKVLDHDQRNTRLLLEKNRYGHLPVTISLRDDSQHARKFYSDGKRNYVNYATAAVMLRAMNDWKVCLASEENDEPAVDFRHLLSKLAEVRCSTKSDLFKLFHFCLLCLRLKCLREKNVSPTNRPPMKNKCFCCCLQSNSLETKLLPSEKHIVDCIEAIMDATVDKTRRVVEYGLLEADSHGHTPDNKNYKSLAKNSIAIVAENNLEIVAGHTSFRDLIKFKWHLYGWKLYLVPLLLYLSFLVLLTISLALAAQVENPSKYSDHIDKGRLFCEVLILMWIPIDIFIESIDFKINYNGNVIRYFTEWRNWLDVIAVLMTLLIIPFRFTNSDVQWIFASLAYIFHGIRLFEYAIILRFFGVYVEVLVHVIIRDLPQFLLVFMVFMTIYGGGFYFALRGQTCPLIQNDVGSAFDPIVNTSLCLHADETGEIYCIWLTGIRLLAEGENIIFPYLFQERGFGGLAAVIYIVFLFLVVVILLNLLIAQFTKSYEEEIGRAHISVTLNRAKALSRMWNPLWMKPLEKIVRLSSYRPNSVTTIEDIPSQKLEDLERQFQTSRKQLTDEVTKLQRELNCKERTYADEVKQLRQELKEQTVMIKELKAAIIYNETTV